MLKAKKPQHFEINFDKATLRKQIVMHSYREARRFVGPIYDVLITELHEDGFPVTAKYFQLEVNIECDYYKSNEIRKRVMDEPRLLLALYDNCRLAEKMARSPETLSTTFRLLNEVLQLLEEQPYYTSFKWLLNDVYRIIIGICDRLDIKNMSCDEPLSQIYYSYANMLNEKLGDYETSIEYYKKALSKIKDRAGLCYIRDIRKDRYEKFNHVIARKKAKAVLNFSKQLMMTQKRRSLALISGALNIMAEAGLEENRIYVIDTMLTTAEIFIEDKNFKLAQRILEDVGLEIPRLAKNDYDPIMDMRLYLNKAICFLNLNEAAKSMTNFMSALKMARQLHQKEFEAKALLHLGNLYLHLHNNQRTWARASYRKALEFFHALGDTENIRKCSYFLAQSMSTSLFPLLIDLMKNYRQYCCLYTLRSWKNQNRPFWLGKEMQRWNEQSGDIDCLINEFRKQKGATTIIAL